MGTAFEALCRAFLTLDPVRARDLTNVETFSAWASTRGITANHGVATMQYVPIGSDDTGDGADEAGACWRNRSGAA